MNIMTESLATSTQTQTQTAEGVLELDPQGNGHLRQFSNNLLPSPQDVRVPSRLIQKYFLKEGLVLEGATGIARRIVPRRMRPMPIDPT